MLNFSDEFINGDAKITNIWLDFTLADGVTTFTCKEDRVSFNGFTRDTSTSVGGEFTIGAAVTGEMRCALNNYDDALSAYDFRNATVIAWLGGYAYSSALQNIHPDADIIEENQFTISNLTAEQLSALEVDGMIALGTDNQSRNIAVVKITDIETVEDVTAVTLDDTISAPATSYISALTIEKINVGRYYVDSYKYDGININIEAFDDMCKFDVPCTDVQISWPTTGKTIGDLINDALSATSISLYNAVLPGPSNYIVTNIPNQWSTMTLHDIIAYCAQIMGCYAHIVYVPNPGTYKLAFDWYNVSQLTSNQYDGGTFSTITTPYSDGATLNGGSFVPWNSEDVADGGEFGDREDVTIIVSPYTLSVDTDDVQITGITVTVDESDNIENAETFTTPLDPTTTGIEGYVINISGNPFIETESQATVVASYLYDKIGGMRFRPLSASIIENPALEAGDTAIISGKSGNVYACFLSHVTYTVNSGTTINCDAASSMQNLKGRYSNAQKMLALINRNFEAAQSSVETAMTTILGTYAASVGLYDISYVDPQTGATIYQFGDHSTAALSSIIWRLTAGALMISNDGGQTWNAALSVDGTAVLQRLYAIGIDADYINTGTLNIGGRSGTGPGQINIKNSLNAIRGIVDANGIRYGKTGISDTTNTGFCLNNDGFILGDGETNRYIKITPDGTTYIYDGSQASGQEITVVDPSFIVEGDDGTGTIRRSYITPTDIVIGEGPNDTHLSMSDGDLVVSGTISNSIGRVIATSGEDSISYIRLVDSGGTVSNVYMQVRSTSGFWGVTVWASDEKLKDDIQNSTVNALDAVNKVKHRSFRWKRNGQHVNNGYIAQEIERVIPEAVLTVPQEDGTVMKQIYEPGLIPYLSKAIQELSNKVNELEMRVKELEGK